jgi:voltage-gated potassium channel
MPIFQRALRLLVSRQSWLLPVVVAVTVFLTSWGLLALVEPDNPMVAPGRYWWYFLVTASTVGYGDFYPSTLPGRLVGAFVVGGGIATLTIIFTRISALIENARGRRMNGHAHHDLSGHVVILGYTPGRTEWLVDQLSTEGYTVVVAAWPDDASQHPMPERHDVHFVRGDLTEIEVLERTSPGRARAVLVDARDDNEAIAVAVAVEAAATDVHTVVTLRDLERARTVRRVNDTVQCVQWHNRQLVVEEVSDPGIAEVYQELMTAQGVGTYSTPVPMTTTYGELARHLGEAHGATLLAVRTEDGVRVNADRGTVAPEGSSAYYIADCRLSETDLVP